MTAAAFALQQQRHDVSRAIALAVAELSVLSDDLGIGAPAQPPPSEPPPLHRQWTAHTGTLDPSGGQLVRSANQRARWRRRAARAGNALISALLAFAVCVAGMLGVSVLRGDHFETVVTGSMQPQIPIGSLVMTDRASAGSLRAGDIIAFPEPCVAAKVIVHRIVQVSPLGGGLVRVRTKGDANPQPDSWLTNCADPSSTGALVAKSSASVDRATYIIPVAGTLLDLFRRMALIGLLGLGAAVALGVGVREVRRYLASRV